MTLRFGQLPSKTFCRTAQKYLRRLLKLHDNRIARAQYKMKKSSILRIEDFFSIKNFEPF